MSTDKSQIRNAATVIVLRDAGSNPKILMGQRGAKAVFMPNKFVFPGGAVDMGDQHVPLGAALNPVCQARLTEDLIVPPITPQALAAAAIRELWEETGLILGQKGTWQDAPEDWQGFAARGFVPDPSALTFVFRALTPPGRPRRFDARFFLIDADQVSSDLDDFSAACDELSHLQWVELAAARSFDMPFITEVVLSEVQKLLPNLGSPASVPFFKNNEEANLFLRLYGPDAVHPDS